MHRMPMVQLYTLVLKDSVRPATNRTAASVRVRALLGQDSRIDTWVVQRSVYPSVKLMSRNSNVLTGVVSPDLVTKVPGITSRIDPAAKVQVEHVVSNTVEREGGAVKLGARELI